MIKYPPAKIYTFDCFRVSFTKLLFTTAYRVVYAIALIKKANDVIIDLDFDNLTEDVLQESQRQIDIINKDIEKLKKL